MVQRYCRYSATWLQIAEGRLLEKFRFVGIKLCKPTEKYNITILHGEEEQKILRCSEVTFCIAVTKSDHF